MFMFVMMKKIQAEIEELWFDFRGDNVMEKTKENHRKQHSCVKLLVNVLTNNCLIKHPAERIKGCVWLFLTLGWSPPNWGGKVMTWQSSTFLSSHRFTLASHTVMWIFILSCWKQLPCCKKPPNPRNVCFIPFPSRLEAESPPFKHDLHLSWAHLSLLVFKEFLPVLRGRNPVHWVNNMPIEGYVLGYCVRCYCIQSIQISKDHEPLTQTASRTLSSIAQKTKL